MCGNDVLLLFVIEDENQNSLFISLPRKTFIVREFVFPKPKRALQGQLLKTLHFYEKSKQFLFRPVPSAPLEASASVGRNLTNSAHLPSTYK